MAGPVALHASCRGATRLPRGLAGGTGCAFDARVPVLILSSVCALFAHLRALADGYTDAAALGRAATVFVAAFVGLRLVGLAWRALRARRHRSSPGLVAPDVTRPVPVYPPRRIDLPEDLAARSDRHRAA
jgi:hypothetical protein